MFLAKFKRINDDSLVTSERPDFYREGHRFDSDILHIVGITVARLKGLSGNVRVDKIELEGVIK